MRYVVVIVCLTVYFLWDFGYHDGHYTRALTSEVGRVISKVF